MLPTETNAPSYLQDEEGFARLLDDWGDRLLRLCTLYLKDVHLAEDAVQETLLKAWRHADTFRGGGSEITWITRIAINVCKSYLRSPWKRRRAPAPARTSIKSSGQNKTVFKSPCISAWRFCRTPFL